MNCPTCSFTWSDHTPVDFEVWRYGEPNNSGGVEHCTDMIEGEWNDNKCDELSGLVPIDLKDLNLYQS